MFPARADEVPAMQDPQRLLNCTFGKTRLLGDVAMAELCYLPAFADCPAPQEQVNDKCRRAMVVTDEVSKQHIRNVLVDAEVAHVSYILQKYSNNQTA